MNRGPRTWGKIWEKKEKRRMIKTNPEVKMVYKYKKGHNKDKKGVLGVQISVFGRGKNTIFWGGGYDVQTEL
jgi:hypothetical protein